ncbi:recombinase family protein [Streptomyces atratus]|uniref:recombinase family protein n=1 Tax=Streptomyces atratus TaxID=1893 RepID=UPI0033C15E2F
MREDHATLVGLGLSQEEPLNEEGRRTRSGATWSPTAVSKLAQSPLFAGMVPVRRRKTDEHGNPLDSWEGSQLLGTQAALANMGTIE